MSSNGVVGQQVRLRYRAMLPTRHQNSHPGIKGVLSENGPPGNYSFIRYGPSGNITVVPIDSKDWYVQGRSVLRRKSAVKDGNGLQAVQYHQEHPEYKKFRRILEEAGINQ